ncbi:MAG: CRTAC1 family protein [Planctomycetota bacterium]|nr:CRTAC1 family protein [Planctomycetota bacterium]MDA1161698.1 CRTAC1 family protein [Planctomycetota bacterium]
MHRMQDRSCGTVTRAGRTLVVPVIALVLTALVVLAGWQLSTGPTSPDISHSQTPGTPIAESNVGPAQQGHSVSGSDPTAPAVFRNVAIEAGLDFQHNSPLTPEKHLHLFMGSGLGWIDLDCDDWPDLMLCQGEPWIGTATTSHSQSHDEPSGNRLYRNHGDGAFGDVTSKTGLPGNGYAMGTTIGDFDNDGFPDLYVSSLGPDMLLRNQGDGTFSVVGLESDALRFGAGCTWADVDNNGTLDLFLANYVNVARQNYPLCHATVHGRKTGSGCHPRFLDAEHDVLLRNEGDGSFSDFTQQSGIGNAPPRQGLGVVANDLDADGDVDIYVANDSVANQLWINDGNGHFEDQAIVAGVAMNRVGLEEAGMGVACGDINGDLHADLLVTNFFKESNTVYRQDPWGFTDVSSEFGMTAASLLRTAFGVSLFDGDNNGSLDVFVANGHIHTHLGTVEPFEQQQQFFINRGGQRLIDVSLDAGPYFKIPTLGRGTAVADFDRDGALDVAVQHLNAPMALLRNESPTIGSATRIQLIGTSSNRNGIGARVLATAGEQTMLRCCQASSSYLSCDEAVIHFGREFANSLERIEVHWPGGGKEVWENVAGEASTSSTSPIRLIEGTGMSLK